MKEKDNKEVNSLDKFIEKNKAHEKKLGRRVSTPKLMLFSTSSLITSFLFFRLATWLSELIIEHASSISRFLKFGFLETPYPFVLITNFIILIIAFKYFFWFVRIASPLSAKAGVANIH